MRNPPTVVKTAQVDYGTNLFNDIDNGFAHLREFLAVVDFVFMKDTVVKTGAI